MAFSRDPADSVGDRWKTLETINALVAKLESKKVRKVSFDPIQQNHSLVWQIRVFEQVALHRAVSLANGCAARWNARDIHGSALFAREMIEITALVYDLAHQLAAVLNTRDLAAARDLLTDRTFGPKDDESGADRSWDSKSLADASVTRSSAVLRIVARIDEDYPGTLETYGHLSEMCRPNSLGVFSMFVVIDKDTKDVTFDYFRHYNKLMFHRIVIACFLLGLFEHSLSEIQSAAQGLSMAVN